MSYRTANAVRAAQGDTHVGALNTGGAGSIQIRTGAQPTNVDDAAVGTLLATLALSNPAFGATNATTGVATANAVTSATAVASGTAGHFRALNGAGSIHSDGSCGTGTGDMAFNNAVIVSGGTVAVSSWTITFPN